MYCLLLTQMNNTKTLTQILTTKEFVSLNLSSQTLERKISKNGHHKICIFVFIFRNFLSSIWSRKIWIKMRWFTVYGCGYEESNRLWFVIIYLKWKWKALCEWDHFTISTLETIVYSNSSTLHLNKHNGSQAIMMVTCHFQWHPKREKKS